MRNYYAVGEWLEKELVQRVIREGHTGRREGWIEMTVPFSSDPVILGHLLDVLRRGGQEVEDGFHPVNFPVFLLSRVNYEEAFPEVGRAPIRQCTANTTMSIRSIIKTCTRLCNALRLSERSAAR